MGNWTCFNLYGTDHHGIQFQREWSVPFGRVNALYFGFTLPENVSVGEVLEYELQLQFEGLESANCDCSSDGCKE